MLNDSDRSMLQGLFGAIDSKDPAAFVHYLTEDAQFRFASAPAAVGQEAIAAAVTDFFETIAGLAHRIDNTIREGNTIVCEGEVTYIRHDDSEISLPFADIFEMNGDRIASYKIYMDVGPLYTT